MLQETLILVFIAVRHCPLENTILEHVLPGTKSSFSTREQILDILYMVM